MQSESISHRILETKADASSILVSSSGRLLSTPLYSLPDRATRGDYYQAVPDPIALDTVDVRPGILCVSVLLLITICYGYVGAYHIPLLPVDRSVRSRSASSLRSRKDVYCTAFSRHSLARSASSSGILLFSLSSPYLSHSSPRYDIETNNPLFFYSSATILRAH